MGIKRYRGTVRVRERISYKAPLTISQKEDSLYPSSKPDTPPPPRTVVFKSQCGTNGERALEKFVWRKDRVAV